MARDRKEWGVRRRSTSPCASPPSPPCASSPSPRRNDDALPRPQPCSPPARAALTSPTIRSMRGGAAGLRGGLWRSGSLDPHHSPNRRGEHSGSKMGIGWSRGGDGSGNGSSSTQNSRRGTWWDVVQQCEVQIGVDFVPDSLDGAGDEFVFLPDSDEVDSGRLNFSTTDDEIVPETQLEDLVAAEYNGMEVQASDVDGGGRIAVVQPAFVAVDSDAETQHAFIGVEGNNTANKVSSTTQDFEDFQLEIWKEFFPVWAHPALEKMRDEKRQ